MTPTENAIEPAAPPANTLVDAVVDDLGDLAPGIERAESHEPGGGLAGYLIGYGLAVLLTIAAFAAAETSLIYPPALVSALTVLAVAQMGVHLVYFLHINTGPDNTNNVLALAFGILIVGLVVIGSIWIMAHLNHNMVPIQMR